MSSFLLDWQVPKESFEFSLGYLQEGASIEVALPSGEHAGDCKIQGCA
jgi:hypothetical protein